MAGLSSAVPQSNSTLCVKVMVLICTQKLSDQKSEANPRQLPGLCLFIQDMYLFFTVLELQR